MYWELLRVDNLHMHSEKYDLMSKPISFTVFSDSLVCVISRDFNIRYFLRRCLNGRSLPHRGDIYIDGQKRRIESMAEAHDIGIYDANLTDMFQNLNVGLNVSMPDIPMYGFGLSAHGQMYDDVKKLIEEFEITDIDPYMICGDLNDFQKQVVMLLRSYMRGAKLILFNFFANYSYSDEELKKLAFIFDKLKNKNVSVLCFSSTWMPEAIGKFDQYIIIENNVVTKNAAARDFRPVKTENDMPFFESDVFDGPNGNENIVLSCRDFPYGDPKENKRLRFDLKEGSCMGILDPRQELLQIKDVLEGKRRAGLERCITHDGVPLYRDRDFLSKTAFLDYGFETEKSFDKLSLYDNITVGAGGAMYKLGFVFSRRIQKFIVNELLVNIDRTDLLELYGDPNKKLDNLDPEDQFVIEICRWLCIKPKAFIFHNFNRNYSLLSSEKVGNLIYKIKNKFKVPVLIIAPGDEELNFFCSEIIRL
jgi:ABC-type sugar transport system ATPase subunit